MSNQRKSGVGRVALHKVEASYDSELKSPLSPTRARAQQLFITEQKIDNNLTEIKSSHHQLNQYIGTLELKVNNRVEKNEAQILIAYKNHIELVKKDMQHLKQQSQVQASSSNNYVQTIQYLQKKLAIFRDQSLKLFQRLDQKDKEFERFRLQKQQLVNENAFLHESLKGLTKKNKQLQIEMSHIKSKSNQELRQFQEDFTQKYDISMLQAGTMKNKYCRQRNRTITTSANLSKAISYNTHTGVPAKKPIFIVDSEINNGQPQLFANKLRIKLNYLDSEVLKEVVRVALESYSEIEKTTGYNRLQSEREQRNTKMERATRISMRSKSNITVDQGNSRGPSSFSLHQQNSSLRQQSTNFKVKQEMSNYFVKCVSTIKKQIARRKEVSPLNFYKEGNPISYEQFKKVDCYKLMGLALSSDKVVEGLYNLLLQHRE